MADNEGDDMDDVFFSSLGVIHHNPDIGFDAEMSLLHTIEDPAEFPKRRKRDEGSSSPSPYIATP